MIFIGARVTASHFVYYILRPPFDGQFHIVQPDIRNDIIDNVSRLFLEIPPPPNINHPERIRRRRDTFCL